MDVATDKGSYLIGVDIGGTCTDVAMIDSRTKQQFFFKTETLPQDVEQGVVNGVAEILKQQNRRPEECAGFIHGTTLALNAVLTRNGAKVGLIVTRGFGDILEVGRLQMPDPFNFYTQKPRPLVRKNFVREVNERILGNGRVDTPLDVADLEKAVDELIKRAPSSLRSLSSMGSGTRYTKKKRRALSVNGIRPFHCRFRAKSGRRFANSSGQWLQ